ncbi:unnamed protein product [Mytilus coruscus]|uniref:TIR domain-containing protein n=1 Tax=Mytilus coruscus TaxID=42192 RepID=A0A6J8DEF4_MYTCO|nr:unnamed protein product [Mytilus coruscus]
MFKGTNSRTCIFEKKTIDHSVPYCEEGRTSTEGEPDDFSDETISDHVSLENFELDIGDVNGIHESFKSKFSTLKHFTNLTRGECKLSAFRQRTFINVIHLEYVDLSTCPIQWIFNDSLSKLRNLRYLNVSNMNLFIDEYLLLFNEVASTNIKQLVIANISDCVISKFPVSVFKVLNNTGLEEFYINNNVFSDATGNQCETVLQLEKECDKHIVIIIVVTIGIAFSAITITAGLAYRYRLKIRYIYYITKGKYTKLKLAENNKIYSYDAFISYADREENFIINECIPNLEETGNKKLCIHQQDFIPGEDITLNITNAIHDCKKTICIITRAFLDSYYCMFEFNMARMESIYARGGENILFLVLHDTHENKRIHSSW